MEQNDYMTVQKYASLNRLSIHTVIKKTMNGELPTITKEENGKEVTYILISPEKTEKTSRSSEIAQNSEDEVEINYKEEYEALHKEHLILKAKYNKLLEAQKKE